MRNGGKEQQPAAAQYRGELHDRVPSVGYGRVVCPNCGGDISVEDARCPYCGALNPSGAEKAYMDALEDLKDDTDKLAEDVQDDVEANFKRSAKWILVFIAAIVAAIVVCFVAIQCADSGDERRELQGYQERESFREQYFPELDRLYEEGDDAALSAYTWSLMNEPGFDALYSWKHFRYLQAHDDWEVLNEFESELDKSPASIDDYVWATSVAIRLACLDADGKRFDGTLTQEEKQRVEGYRAFAWSFLQDMLQMSAEEVEAFAASVEDSQGNIKPDKVKEGLKLRFGQLEAAS